MFEKVRIGDLGEIYTGNTPSKKNKEFYATEDIMFIKPDILSFDIRFIDKSNEYISEKAKEKARVIPKGSLLVSCIGNIGKLGINNEEVAFNQQINAIIHNNKICSSKYLAYLLKYNQKKLEAIANAPVVPIINKSQFSDFEVVIHKELFEQKQLVEILDKAQQLIDKRKEQIEALDELVKSKFIEMFGALKDEEKLPLEKCTTFIDYRGKTPTLSESGIRIINAKSVGNGFFKYIDEYISEETYDLWMKRGFPVAGDVLFVTEGHTFGNVCRIPNDLEKFAMGQRVITIQGKEELLNNIFLAQYMQSMSFKIDIDKYKTGSSAQGIRSKELKKILIPIPNIELQNKFADFVKQVDKLKFEMEKSLKELEDNFNSLMQRAFNGELF